jgi:spore germination protein
MWRQRQTTYTVKAGDSLYQIAQRFNTTVEAIVALNNLTSTALNVGQRLIIPVYTEAIITVDNANVRSGSSTSSPVVARLARGAKLRVTGSRDGWRKVKLYNGNDAWVSNQVSRLVAHGGEKPIASIVGFYTLPEGPALPGSYNSFVNNLDIFSEAPLFFFRIDRNNPTQIEKFGRFTDEEIRTLIDIGHRHNIRMMPIVHNLLYRPGGTRLAKDLVKRMVATRESRRTFIQNVINLIERYGFDGANIDIEDVNMEDSERLSAFYTELGAAMKSKGHYLSASVPARISDRPINPFSDPFNYSVIGKAVDEFIVMLYNEYGWPGSPPGPAVSGPWETRVVNYTKSKMPADKIIAALSVFGFDFNRTTGRNTYVTYQMAMDLAKRYNRQVRYDERQMAATFSYTAENGDRHEVWFENRRSIDDKTKMAYNLGIKGVALWRLGMEDPDIWTGLREEIVTRKE